MSDEHESSVTEKRRHHLRITGRVQGVWFRAFTKEQADALALTGWVRNLPDGGVEACAEGSPAALAELRERCSRGPAAAQVEGVVCLADDPATGAFTGFIIKR